MRAPPFHNRGCRTQSAGHVTLSGKICKLLVHDTGAKTSTKVVVVVGELVPLVVLSHLLREVAPPLEISTPLSPSNSLNVVLSGDGGGDVAAPSS